LRRLQPSHANPINSLIAAMTVFYLPSRPCSFALRSFKAHGGNRTRDLFLTKEVLYRLSYMGKPAIQRFLLCVDPVGLERETGLEPATPSLEGSRSTN
jgi:hypothetical protein